MIPNLARRHSRSPQRRRHGSHYLDHYLVCHFTTLCAIGLTDLLRLIVAACLVETVSAATMRPGYGDDHTHSYVQGEVLARLVVHATTPAKDTLPIPDPETIANMTREQAVWALQQIANAAK